MAKYSVQTLQRTPIEKFSIEYGIPLSYLKEVAIGKTEQHTCIKLKVLAEIYNAGYKDGATLKGEATYPKER